MENTAVIIDGVDVSNCVMLNDDNPENGLSECGYICKGTSCKYKSKILKQELKTKTLECEKLKKQMDIAKMAYEGCLANKEGRHKREIETLKSALEEIEKIINQSASIGGLELSADKVDKIQEIILKAKEQE